jgi:hypothetical protein
VPRIADQYLHVAADILDLTADMVIGAHIAPINLNETVDHHASVVEDDYDYRGLADDITAQVTAWWPNAKEHQRAIVAVAGLLQSENALRELVWSVTGPLSSAYLVRHGRPPSGVHADFAVEYDDLLKALDFPNIQVLRDPSLIHAVLDRDESLQRYCRLLKDQYERAVEGLRDLDAETCAIAQRLARQRYEEAQAIAAATNAREAGRNRRQTRQVRKAVRRGVRAMDEIIGAGSYKGFISKDGFVITGCLFDYHVSKSVRLLEHTASPRSAHIPYRLEMRNKAGELLGRACIIFPDTPVLDQVIALALHVREHETECRLVKTLNWLSLTASGREDPDLRQLRPVNKASTDVVWQRHFVQERHFSYRRRIMNCIECDAARALSDYIGMPLTIFQFMRDPENAPTDDVPLLANCFQMMHALVMW